jgi:predicted alpha/beta superfamily hydrolase
MSLWPYKTLVALTFLALSALTLGGCAEDEGGEAAQDTFSVDTSGTSGATDTSSTDTSGATSDDTSGATSDDTSGATSDDTSGATSDDTSGATSDDTSGATSDDTSGATSSDTTDTADASDTIDPSDLCPPPPSDLPTLTETRAGRFVEVAGFPGIEGLSARDLTLYLPADYDADPDARYPVLYMHDGQNLYNDTDAAFGVAWEVDDTLDALVSAGKVRPHIVVGIHNTPARIKDYTPSIDPDRADGGDGAAYMELVATRIKPYVDAHFKTLCGPQNAAIAGSSLGGLISLHQMMTTPEVFGRVAAVSPSLWWNNAEALGMFAAYQGPLPQRLWIDAGSEEGDDVSAGLRSVATNSRAALATAQSKGMTLGDDVAYMEHIWASHDEASWEQRLPSILGYLLSDDPVTARPVSDLWVYVHAPVIPSDSTSASAIAINTQYDDAVWLTTFADDPAATLTPTAGVVHVDASGHLSADAEGMASVQVTRGTLSAGAALLVDNDDDALVTVVFTTSTPPNTTGPVYVVGSDAALGAWDSSPGVAMTAIGGGYWAAEVQVTRGALAYKYTLGSWATVEKGPSGQEVANRTLDATAPALTRDAVALWAQ